MSNPVTVSLRASSNRPAQSMSSEERDQVDWSKLTNVPSITAGSGLTGGGPLTADVTLALQAGTIQNSNLASVASKTLKGNSTASTAVPSDLSVATVSQMVEAINTDVDAGTSTDSLITPRKLKRGYTNSPYYVATGTGAQTRAPRDKARDVVAVYDYLTSTEKADVIAGTATNDHTSSVQNAITAAAGAELNWGPGVYSVTSLTGVSFTRWSTSSSGNVVLRKRGSTPSDLVTFSGKSFFEIHGVQFDNGDLSDSFPYACLALTTASNFTVESCRFVKFDKLGIAVNAGTIGYINNNYLYKTAAASQGVNEAILIGVSAGASNNITVSNNTCINSGIISVGPNISFINNYVSGWQYGAGISTSTDGGSDYNSFIGNFCQSGTGLDSDGFDLKGIESWGRYAKIIGNSCIGNSGPGIWVGGQFSAVEGNFCLNNGTYGSTVNAGIIAAYYDSDNNAQYSVVANNICWDSLGGSGTQKYGIAIDYRNDQISVTDNQVYQNKTKEYFVYNGVSADENTAITFRGRTYTKSFTWNPSSIANGATETSVQTVAYASLTDFVQASCSLSQAGLTLTAYVSSANQVTAVLTNDTGGAVDLASATFRIFGQQALY